MENIYITYKKLYNTNKILYNTNEHFYNTNGKKSNIAKFDMPYSFYSKSKCYLV